MPRRTNTQHILLQEYENFKTKFKENAISFDTTNAIQSIYLQSTAFLRDLNRIGLTVEQGNKSYFSFERPADHKISRAVNSDLFLENGDVVLEFLSNIRNRTITAQNAEIITKACYTIAISFCSSIDLIKENDQKTPGTFFEYFMGHMFSVQFNLSPSNNLDVLNMDMRATLPTDFIFDLGDNRPKFHVPIKTSTRERVVQVWAHQRVLDGVYGTGRFLGLLSCLSETKVDHRTNEVTEICLPDQWRVYQLFIAQMKRIYYLDVPQKYADLNRVFPRIHVKQFGDFFFEAAELCS